MPTMAPGIEAAVSASLIARSSRCAVAESISGADVELGAPDDEDAPDGIESSLQADIEMSSATAAATTSARRQILKVITATLPGGLRFHAVIGRPTQLIGVIGGESALQ